MQSWIYSQFIETPVSNTSFLKNGMRVYCLDLEIRQNTLFLLHVRTDRFKRSFVLYARRSFPTDISEDFYDDFIDSWCYLCILF